EPDDLVLFGLDRGHDVTHPVTARRVDGGEQGGVTTALSESDQFATAGAAEKLVGEIDHPARAGVKLTATPHAFRVGGGGGVERPCQRCPPVEETRFVVVL